jgi:glutamine cyclotransferase
MKLNALFSIKISCLSVILLWNCGGESEVPVEVKSTSSKIKSTPTIDFVYVNSYPHDTNSFTEGFLVHKGDLYESTGATNELLQTKSLFGIVDSSTGIIEAKVELDSRKYFGEGITFLDDKVYQLTYKAKIGFVYDAVTFKEIDRFNLPSEEGWGLTTDGTDLIMSDGTNNLVYLNPEKLNVVKTISVSENGIKQDKLNELEFINGYIYANVWMTNIIVKIDPQSGKILGKLNLTTLVDEAKYYYPKSLEMNGIAFDSEADKIFVTGKLWPKYFEIDFNH